MKNKMAGTAYDLIPSQQTMHYMLKYSLHKQVMQIPMSLTVSEKLDFDTLQKAVEIECRRNDCMRLRYFKERDKYGSTLRPTAKEAKFRSHLQTKEDMKSTSPPTLKSPSDFLKARFSA